MKFKLKYQAPKGKRIKNDQFFAMDVDGLYYDEINKIWTGIGNIKEKDVFSSIKRCFSVKAFCRELRKNPYIIGKARLICIYQGYDVYC